MKQQVFVILRILELLCSITSAVLAGLYYFSGDVSRGCFWLLFALWLKYQSKA
jgi:hypothetical protein